MGSDKVHIHEVNRVSMTASTVESSKRQEGLFQRQEGLRQTQVPDHL